MINRRRSDRGAVLVLTALLLTALVLIVAIVIDLGATRSDRRGGQVAVDNAAAAAAQGLGESDPRVACEDAFAYLAISLETAPFVGDPCTALPVVCTASTDEVPVRRAVGDFEATVVYPVKAAADSAFALMDAASTISGPTFGPDASDGQPCDRVGVEVTTRGAPFFGAIAGSTERTSTVHAVGLIQRGTRVTRPINLLVLNRTQCQVFTIGGGATVIVASPTDDPTAPGIAAVDSDASDTSSCNPSKSTLELNGTGATLTAQGLCETDPETNTCGDLELFAPVSAGLTGTCSSSGVDVPACNEGSGNIATTAVELPARYTRAPVDARYNCKVSYVSELWFTAQPIGACPDATADTDYIDELKAYASTGSAPPGFTAISGSGCSPGSTTYPPGNYWVNCGTFRINGGANVAFTAGNVIFTGNVAVTSGHLTLNACGASGGCTGTLDSTWRSGDNFNESQWAPKGAWAYVGGVFSNSSTLTINNTAVILGSVSGRYDQGGSAVTRWTAPDEMGVAGSAGPFDDLALWSEGFTTATGPTSAPHSFRGGGTSYFEGMFFGGRAAFDLAGSGPVDLRVSQFVSDKLNLSGAATFTMSPVASRSVEFPTEPTYALIR